MRNRVVRCIYIGGSRVQLSSRRGRKTWTTFTSMERGTKSLTLSVMIERSCIHRRADAYGYRNFSDASGSLIPVSARNAPRNLFFSFFVKFE